MKPGQVTFNAGDNKSNVTGRLLYKPVSLWVKFQINLSIIPGMAGRMEWTRISGIARCSLGQAIWAWLGYKPTIKNKVELLVRCVNDRIHLCTRYTFAGMESYSHHTYSGKPGQWVELKLKLPGFIARHKWGLFLSPQMESEAKKTWSFRMQSTVGGQRPGDPYNRTTIQGKGTLIDKF